MVKANLGLSGLLGSVKSLKLILLLPVSSSTMGIKDKAACPTVGGKCSDFGKMTFMLVIKVCNVKLIADLSLVQSLIQLLQNFVSTVIGFVTEIQGWS